MRAAALAFAFGTIAGAIAHKRYMGPLFALEAIRQVLAARREAITADNQTGGLPGHADVV